MGTAQLFSLLRFFVHICGPMIIPAFVASRFAPEYIIEHGSQVCFDVSNASMDRNGKIDDLAAGNFMIEMGRLVTIVKSFFTIPPLLNRDLHFGIAQRAFDFATQAISTIESPIIPQTYNSQMKPIVDTHYASWLWTTVPEQMTTPIPRVHPAIRSAMDRLTKPFPAADFAHSMMRHARSIQFCFAAGCSESAQSSGRVYMRCSGCRVIAYCSKACQKRSWTDGHLPHRDICKKMKQVYDIGGDYLRREEDQAKFMQEMKRAKIKDVVLGEIGMWMCEAYMKLQRKGPFLTAEAREYLSQKGGPLFTTETRKFMSEIQNSFLSNPKRRRARG
jgi:MYND finger